MERCDGYDKVMQRLGVGFISRMLSSLMKPILIIRNVGNSYYGIRREGKVKSIESFFKLGEKFKEVTPDYREVMSIIFMENGIMRHEQLGPGKPVHIKRMIVGEGALHVVG